MVRRMGNSFSNQICFRYSRAYWIPVVCCDPIVTTISIKLIREQREESVNGDRYEVAAYISNSIVCECVCAWWSISLLGDNHSRTYAQTRTVSSQAVCVWNETLQFS